MLQAWMEILKVSAKLGLTSFGGPVAHLGYFREEYVSKRKWLDESSYADLVALCQFLPGPASSQVGIGIGLMRGGLTGAILAWIGFTLPSVVLMVLFAYIMFGVSLGGAGWIHGLKIAAVAVVAQAVWGMGRTLAPDRTRATIAVLSAAAVLLWTSPGVPLLLIVLAGLAGILLYKDNNSLPAQPLDIRLNRKAGAAALVCFFALLLLLPLLRMALPSPWTVWADSFYRSGSLVFGGGHVVLPLLEKEFVPTGWMSRDAFLAGYGAAQAVPGPLFTFAAYLGAVMGGWKGAAAAVLFIFLPAFLLVIGALPFWETLRRSPRMKGALWGVNAAVVGLLLAALYNPVWTSAIRSSADFALAAAVFGLLVYWKLPPWLVVAVSAVGGSLIG